MDMALSAVSSRSPALAACADPAQGIRALCHIWHAAAVIPEPAATANRMDKSSLCVANVTNVSIKHALALTSPYRRR